MNTLLVVSCVVAMFVVLGFIGWLMSGTVWEDTSGPGGTFNV